MRRKFTLFTLVFSLFTQLLSAQTIQDLKAPLTFFIVNDLGRNGYYQQKKIAELMILWLPICGHILQKLHSLTNQQHQPPPLWSKVALSMQITRSSLAPISVCRTTSKAPSMPEPPTSLTSPSATTSAVTRIAPPRWSTMARR